jgi:lipase chaperone LimK
VKLFKQNSPLAQSKIARTATVFVASTLLVGLTYFAFAPANPPSQAAHNVADPGGLQLPRAPSLLAAGAHGGDAVAISSPVKAPELQQSPSQANSLSNTQADGDWSIGANGQAQPSRALRRRFDYLLLQLGEVALDSMANQVRQQVQKAHGAAAALQIMALWDSYLRLQQHAWSTQVDMQRPDTWANALAERSTVRRQILGPAWADAFYGDEENELRQMIAQASSGMPVSSTATAAAQAAAPTALPDAAQRTAEHEAQWQQWEQRLATARSRIQQLRSAPELSDPQRQEAISTYLHQQFNGAELPRAKALLKI